MVTPPTLKAAKPVGAVMAHVMSLDGHSSHTNSGGFRGVRGGANAPPFWLLVMYF